MKELRHAGSFDAYDEDGEVNTILIFVEFSWSKPDGWIPGLTLLKTTDGRHVNRIETGQYEIVEDSFQLTSDDSNAV